MRTSEAELLVVDIDVVDEEPELAVVPAVRMDYRLAYQIASGGMASVHLAFPDGASGPEDAVAIKKVHPHLASQRSFVEMFLDEARIAAQIEHPNVARVCDYGFADGDYFLTMELLSGHSLASVTRGLHRLSDEERGSLTALACHVIAEAADGLHAAHELRDASGAPMEVVHRDVSPHNLFVTYDGSVRVVDFGIARARGRTHHTETGTVKGKFAYMAPEQMLGGAVDRRADVWSLGVVLFELLSGRALFKCGSETETVLAVSNHTRVPIEVLPEDLPPAVVELLERALHPEVEERLATASEFANALRSALRELPERFAASHLEARMDALFPGAAGREAARVQEAYYQDLPRFDGTGPVEESAVVRRQSAPGRPPRKIALLGFLAAPLIVAAVFGIIFFLSVRSIEATDEAGKNAVAQVPPASPVAAPIEPVLEERPPESATDHESEPEAAEAETTSETRSQAEPLPSLEEPTARGRVAVSTVGGWADVYSHGRHLGTTPGRFVLPAGTHTLMLRPHGGTETRRVRVRVPAGGTRRVRVEL